MDMVNYEDYYGTKGEKVCCGAQNTGLFEAIKEQRTLEWVSCGHDHDNDYYGQYQGIYLAFGRKMGYGAYGPKGMLRGGRIFEIQSDPYQIKTWIR